MWPYLRCQWNSSGKCLIWCRKYFHVRKIPNCVLPQSLCSVPPQVFAPSNVPALPLTNADEASSAFVKALFFPRPPLKHRHLQLKLLLFLCPLSPPISSPLLMNDINLSWAICAVAPAPVAYSTMHAPRSLESTTFMSGIFQRRSQFPMHLLIVFNAV